MQVCIAYMHTQILRKCILYVCMHIYACAAKAYAYHLLGVQVMATISVQCISLPQIHSSVYFWLKICICGMRDREK